MLLWKRKPKFKGWYFSHLPKELQELKWWECNWNIYTDYWFSHILRQITDYEKYYYTHHVSLNNEFNIVNIIKVYTATSVRYVTVFEICLLAFKYKGQVNKNIIAEFNKILEKHESFLIITTS